ncbi:MAG: hypothetical protein ACXWHF_02110 [Chthoniobacterales bacterium]
MSEPAEQTRRRRESGAGTLRPGPALLPELKTVRFPIRLLTLVCLLTIMAFAWFGWILFDVGRDAKVFLDKGSRIEELRGVIVHLDEVLTMSARMAAVTGDSRWEERYRQFEPQLDAAIKETTEFAS